MSIRRLMITGASGFIGSWALKYLVDTRRYGEILAVGRSAKSEMPSPCEFRSLDLLDPEATHRLVADYQPTHLLHLAGVTGAKPLETLIRGNVLTTANLYRAVAAADHSPQRIVEAGTAARYGRVPPEELPVDEARPPRPLTDYGLSKYCQELVARKYSDAAGLSIVRACIFNSVGPGQPLHLVPMTFIAQLKTDGEKLLAGDVDARRDFVDVRDVARALAALLEGGEAGAMYNVGSGRDYSIAQVLQQLEAISGITRPLQIEQSRIQKGETSVIRADISRITKAVGWRPHIALEDSLRAMWQHREAGEDLRDDAP